MMGPSMDVIDPRIRTPRPEGFEPQPLRIPAPELKEPCKDNCLVDDKKSGTHVVVIDIS
jgi:hypothetical protein